MHTYKAQIRSPINQTNHNRPCGLNMGVQGFFISSLNKMGNQREQTSCWREIITIINHLQVNLLKEKRILHHFLVAFVKQAPGLQKSEFAGNKLVPMTRILAMSEM